MTLENFRIDTRWKCLDADGDLVGHVEGATAEEAINAYIKATLSDPFRRQVHTLVRGGIRLNVENIGVPRGGRHRVQEN